MHRGKVDPVVSELQWGNELSRDHVNGLQHFSNEKSINKVLAYL